MPENRIAMFGGTFDPPHRGHVAVALAAADRFALSQVLFVPTGRQPLKPEGATAPFADRFAMTTLACRADPRFLASDLERPNDVPGPNYTVNTLDRLRAVAPGCTLFNLVGADSFHDLARWNSPQRLLESVDWIVVSRPGSLLADPAGLTLTPAQRARVHLLDTVHETVSATELRSRLKDGLDTRKFLAPAVADYIAEHQLYR